MIDRTPSARLNEPHYVAWVRERQRAARRLSGWLSQRRAKPDLDHEERVDVQTLVWAERHAHEHLPFLLAVRFASFPWLFDTELAVA